MRWLIFGLLALGLGVFLAYRMNMNKPATKPYGAWPSPLGPELVADPGARIGEFDLAGDTLYWVESRPAEQGRNAVVALRDGKVQDATPAGFNARTRVHEYGGGNLLADGGSFYFPNFDDQRLYRQSGAGQPVAITPAGAMRYADCRADRLRQRLICVGEDHADPKRVRNLLLAVPMSGVGAIQELFTGSDFVAAPTLAPEGQRLAWISWDHPNMPWDKTTLWLADIAADGSLRNPQRFDGASFGEPQWAPDGKLYFVSDESGWWNLYRLDGRRVTPVHRRAADFSGPAWLLGQSNYTILDANTLVASFRENAVDRLLRIDLADGSATALAGADAFVDIQQLRRLDEHSVAFLGAGKTDLPRLVKLDLRTGAPLTLYSPGERRMPEAFIATAQAISYPVAPNEVAHAFYYPPQNPDYRGPAQERPPLIVSAHGGPTAHRSPAFSYEVQFWTTRGFAYLEVNYRGSTGFGREYRNKLRGGWGIVDIEDVVKGAEYVAAQGLADPKRLIVRGGSAGGYVVLAAHAFHEVFATGASYYGVSDLAALAEDTHKFESRYLDGLVGPYPEAAAVYAQRSPLSKLDGFTRPLILFQGLEDEIVPPAQSDRIVAALRSKGITVEYLTFPGEQHGFRKRENRLAALEAELAFYQRVLNLGETGTP